MTELIWDGKYEGRKKQGPVRIALPFQPIETVNESAQDRQRTLELFSAGREAEWRNRLIWGDKKYVLPSLLPEFAGKVDLNLHRPAFRYEPGLLVHYHSPRPGNSDEENDLAIFTKEPSVSSRKPCVGVRDAPPQPAIAVPRPPGI